MRKVYELKRLVVRLAMGIVTLAVMGLDGRSVVQATDHAMNIEITITDLGYEVKAIRHPIH